MESGSGKRQKHPVGRHHIDAINSIISNNSHKPPSRSPPVQLPHSHMLNIATNPLKAGSGHRSEHRAHKKRASPDSRDFRERQPVKKPFSFTKDNPELKVISNRYRSNRPGVVEVGEGRNVLSGKKRPSRAHDEKLQRFFNNGVVQPSIREVDSDDDLFPTKKFQMKPAKEKPASSSTSTSTSTSSKDKKAKDKVKDIMEKKETVPSTVHDISSDDDRPVKSREQKLAERPKIKEKTRPKADLREPHIKIHHGYDMRSKKEQKLDPLSKFLATKPPPKAPPPPPPVTPPTVFSVYEIYFHGETWNQDKTEKAMQMTNQTITMSVVLARGKAGSVKISPMPALADKEVFIRLDEIHSVQYTETFQALVFKGLASGNVLKNGEYFEDIAVKLDPTETNEKVDAFLAQLPCKKEVMGDKQASEVLRGLGGLTRVPTQSPVPVEVESDIMDVDEEVKEVDVKEVEVKEGKDEGKGKEVAKEEVAEAESTLTPRRSARLKAKPIPSFGDTRHYVTKAGKRMEITANDVEQLHDCEYLNDTLISLFLQIEHDQLPEETDDNKAEELYQAARAAAPTASRDLERLWFNPLSYSNTHVFSTYFVHKLLTMPSKDPRAGYQQMKKWTSKIDIFSKQCLIIPIVEHQHWYVMVLWNLGAAHKWKGRKHEGVAPATIASKELEGLDRVVTGSAGRVTRSMVKGVGAEVAEGTEATAKEEGAEGTEATGEGAAEGATSEAPVSEGASAEAPAEGAEGPTSEATSEVPASSQATSEAGLGQGVGPNGPPPAPRKKYKPLKDDECIWMFSLDSLNIPHRHTAGAVFDYVALEASERLKIDIPALAFKYRDLPVPIQTNTWDCGVYLIQFMQMFLSNPSKFLPQMAHLPGNKPRAKTEFRRMWSTKNQTLDKREELTKRVFELPQGAVKGGVLSEEETPDEDESDDEVLITSSVNHSPVPKAELTDKEEKVHIQKSVDKIKVKEEGQRGEKEKEKEKKRGMKFREKMKREFVGVRKMGIFDRVMKNS